MICPWRWRDPRYWLALGLGSGCSPYAPGTVGTFVGLLLYWPLSALELHSYLLLLVAATSIGVWVCDQVSRELGQGDPGCIVWDEIVGYWLTMVALPAEWTWMLAGFLLFRMLDILKPWPIGWLDRRVRGGWGIMLDDLAAGALAALVLHGVRWSGW